MKHKDSVDVIDAFLQILKMARDVPKILSTDNDTAYTGSDFKKLCKTFEIIHQTNVKDDHHALGIIDRFARTTKSMFTTMFLKQKNNNYHANSYRRKRWTIERSEVHK
jgi:transposase InsO family protein